ncbi:MAG: hypothetical protein JSW03_08730 [Candidatus Eiseniibacteriota bacterium]|nr:MAG: hypothetical protein JSW03_08730 [Candidatus Eisenbacteria bacterium]
MKDAEKHQMEEVAALLRQLIEHSGIPGNGGPDFKVIKVEELSLKGLHIECFPREEKSEPAETDPTPRKPTMS